MANKIKAKIVDDEKYKEYTGEKPPTKGIVSLFPDEAEILFKVGCIELTKLQQEILEKHNQQEEQAKTGVNKEADELRKNPNFFDLCVKEIGKRVTGEEKTITTLGVVACGRLVTNSKKTSYNAAPNDESGIGKDWVTNNTLKLFVPKNCLIHRTRISPAVLNYWHNPKFEPNWTWDGKVLYLQDVSDNILNSEVMKTFLSDGSTATILQKQIVVDICIVGKPVVIFTFANTTPNKETLRRIQQIPLDSSEAQTERIKEFEAKETYEGGLPEYDQSFFDAIESLEKVKVIIPKDFAKAVIIHFPKTKITRTLMGRFFDYIKAVCAFHQYQRQKDKQGRLIIEKPDYEIAKEAFVYTTFSKSGMPVTKNEKRILEVMAKKGEEQISVPVLFTEINFLQKRALYDAMNNLCDKGYIKKDRIEINKGTEDYPRLSELDVYTFVKYNKFTLPSYEKLISCENTAHTTQATHTAQPAQPAQGRAVDAVCAVDVGVNEKKQNKKEIESKTIEIEEKDKTYIGGGKNEL